MLNTITFEQIDRRVTAHYSAEAPAPIGVTPRGHAVVTLIRAGWLRDLAPGARELVLYGIGSSLGLLGEDRRYLTELVAAHCGED